MQTIQLRVSDKIYKNLFWFLGRFTQEEIQVINENNEFLSVRAYLEKELGLIESGKGDFIGVEELDNYLEKTIG